MAAKQLLDALFEADREMREAEARLLAESNEEELVKALERATDAALTLEDRREAHGRLIRLSDLCAQVQGQQMANTLLRILNHEAPEVRVAAGEALRDFAYDRYAEVARAIERACDEKLAGPALTEVPWILAEIGEASALPLIGRCLSHPDVEVVASAIEALAELGDPEAVGLLKPFSRDKRVVELNEADQSYSTSIAELAQEAIAELSS
ncbi:MAG TPA: HEAT repeat domain-containing protein [Polyangiales bacterium]